MSTLLEHDFVLMTGLRRRSATPEHRAEMTERAGVLVANFDRLCAERGMTSEEVVQRGGLATSTLQKMRNKETFDPHLSTVLKLSAGLGVPPAQLLVGMTALSPRQRTRSWRTDTRVDSL
jgi:DNA-binding Xre family transcriptional regulator